MLFQLLGIKVGRALAIILPLHWRFVMLWNLISWEFSLKWSFACGYFQQCCWKCHVVITFLNRFIRAVFQKKSFWTTCESLCSWQVSRNNILQVCPFFPSKFKTEIHKKLCFQYIGMYSYSFFLILFGILFGRLISLLYVLSLQLAPHRNLSSLCLS